MSIWKQCLKGLKLPLSFLAKLWEAKNLPKLLVKCLDLRLELKRLTVWKAILHKSQILSLSYKSVFWRTISRRSILTCILQRHRLCLSLVTNVKIVLTLSSLKVKEAFIRSNHTPYQAIQIIMQVARIILRLRITKTFKKNTNELMKVQSRGVRTVRPHKLVIHKETMRACEKCGVITVALPKIDFTYRSRNTHLKVQLLLKLEIVQ